MGPARQRFLDHVRRECARHSIRLRLSPGRCVDQGDGAGCGGYFDEDGRTLAVATGRPAAQWFDTLAHEYCHLLQWAAHDPLWMRSSFCGYFEWASGAYELPRSTATLASRRHLAMERDCELRTSDLLRRWGLADHARLRHRAQETNTYVMLYAWMERFRAWPQRRPYSVPVIVASMPTRVMPLAWFARVPDWYTMAMFENCLSRRQRALAWEWHSGSAAA